MSPGEKGRTELLDRVLRCPRCGSGLAIADEAAACRGPDLHRFEVEDGVTRLADTPPGKYDRDYAARYAFAWAYGAETMHSGWVESLYRTVSSLVGEILFLDPSQPRLIVDAGCGVGRVAANCAGMGPEHLVLGFDASPEMLRLAQAIVCGDGEVRATLGGGLGELRIGGKARENVRLFQSDVVSLPLHEEAADVVLSVNVIDRVTSTADGPASTVAECRRVLKPGGWLVLTDPLNWTVAELWDRYRSSEAVVEMIEANGFVVETWFDELLYRERLDARGASEKWPTLVVKARKR